MKMLKKIRIKSNKKNKELLKLREAMIREAEEKFIKSLGLELEN